jgi:hypothetical protein
MWLRQHTMDFNPTIGRSGVLSGMEPPNATVPTLATNLPVIGRLDRHSDWPPDGRMGPSQYARSLWHIQK